MWVQLLFQWAIWANNSSLLQLKSLYLGMKLVHLNFVETKMTLFGKCWTVAIFGSFKSSPLRKKKNHQSANNERWWGGKDRGEGRICFSVTVTNPLLNLQPREGQHHSPKQSTHFWFKDLYLGFLSEFLQSEMARQLLFLKYLPFL